VQCHYCGYHATTGLTTIDYFIGDQETVPSEFQDQFAEELFAMEGPWIVPTVEQDYIPAEPTFSVDYPVFGSFNQIGKVTDRTLEFWSSALHAVPSSVLLIKDRGAVNKSTRDRITAFFNNQEIGSDRIRFLPAVPNWSDHLALYNCIDIALDTTPWSSATTGFDAVAMGLPLMAIQGDRTASRMSSSIVKHLGREEWISRSPDEFGSKIRDLCTDLDSLRAGKGTRQREALGSRNLESSFRTMIQKRAFMR
jgi:predicted O-linked N-acetylglucosamine transferase (SPINDLY family)